MDPNVLATTDFSDFASTYDEFRVLGCRIHILSAAPNSTTLLNGIAAVAFDNDTSVTPSSFSVVRQFSTSYVLSLINSEGNGKPMTYTWWRPERGAETNIPWIDVATSSGSIGGILIYADGITASSTYIITATELFCEFRGRR
jgi:hypothetical protein